MVDNSKKYKDECLVRYMLNYFNGDKDRLLDWQDEREAKSKTPDPDFRQIIEKEWDKFKSRDSVENQMQLNRDDVFLKKELAK